VEVPVKKLTLSSDPEVIAEAHRLAEQSGTSISSMFERFIRHLAGWKSSTVTLGPLTRKATGMIAMPKDRSDREILEEALLEKYSR
jgi:hypothetical protein